MQPGKERERAFAHDGALFAVEKGKPGSEGRR